nr:DEAD/DEAH box helicase [Bacillus horti]
MIPTLQPFIQGNWRKAGFTAPSTVQLKAIPQGLEGKDMIVESPTGTGKTLAYLIPLLEKMEVEKKEVQAVILAPSRELVMQIQQEFQKWSEGSGLTGTALIGGANVKNQIEKLKGKPQFIVGTPGRILELIKLKKLKMHQVRTIVLDEGDQLLVPEHKETIHQITKTTLQDRQLLLFSATLPQEVEQGMKELMKNAEVLRIKKDKEASGKVEHIYIVCEQREKIDVLRKLVRMGDIKALGFVRDIGNLSVIGEKLTFGNLDMAVLHSDTRKNERAKALKDLRIGNVPLLLATDVAARGLDIEDLTHVIHVDLAKDAQQYIHRSGRTGRMGRSGVVVSIVNPREERDLKKLEKELDLKLKEKFIYKGQLVDQKRNQEAKRSMPSKRSKGKQKR